ncbi:hypothetical protein ACFYNY_29735 [Streptomyces sp. NPDC006530]|uniref:hypothetical protein n=1 Tax=Streptomyces sp. NPDC006530 TaxID=3364750 RepID=UPI00367E9AD7
MHKHIRTAGIAAAGLSVALVLTGCGSGDGGGDKKAAPTASATGAATTGTDGAGTVKAGDLTGPAWFSETDKDVVLLFTSQKTVTLTGRHLCVGKFDSADGMTMVTMSECNGDDKDKRSRGMLKLTNGTLEVDWEGFKKETFTRGTKGKLPTGLPTAGLPTP